jgi:tetratricopeptide (TPR) repeat protein
VTEIRAFVGHSFTQDDTTLVRKFTDYFDKIATLVPGFSWEHAEPAEPKQLSEKVISLLSDKNVFIGICTRKEIALQDSKMRRRTLRRGFVVDGDELIWKTSDWVIQEIGLAVGKNLKLILLVENGIRAPGGLQGNIEYIPFDRKFPESSFTKLLEMIKAVLPTAPVTIAEQPVAVGVAITQEVEKAAKPDFDWTKPRSDWDRGRYRVAYVHFLVMAEDPINASRISEAYLATAEARAGDNAAVWEAFCEYWRIVEGSGGTIETLRKIADAHRQNSEIQEFLARAYEHFEEYEKAAAIYGAVVANGADEAEMIRVAGSAAIANSRAGNAAAAAALLAQLRASILSNGIGEVEFLRIMKQIADLNKDTIVSLAALERLVYLEPTNADDRFALAYLHSDTNNEELALFHYLRIPYTVRSRMAWNNLGVAFNHFALRTKAVAAFRRSADLGETLAMSNLAQNFLFAGFLSEAQAECDRALSIEGYHKNIPNILVRLQEEPEEEDRKEDEVLSRARPKSEFYQRFGEALTSLEPSQLDGRWSGPHCILEASFHDSKFLATGTYERTEQTNPLMFAAFGGAGTHIIKYEVSYQGTLIGRAIRAQLKHTGPGSGASASLLGAGDVESDVLLIVSADGSEIDAMELSASGTARFYPLRRL